jgi:hypothetical protein
LDGHRPEAPTLVYQQTRDEKETFVVGKREFRLTQGRVFLVRVNGSDVSVHQLGARLGGLFESTEVDFEALAKEVSELRQTDPRVRRFWAGEDPEAEDADS